jgi:hypothetical protein
MSRIDEIIRRRKDDDAAKDGNAPIHRTRHHGCRHGEEGEYEDGQQVAESEDVDETAVAAERPSMRGEGFAADTFEEDAGDGYHVGGGEGADGEGDDGVEGGGGADVDEGEEDGYDKGDDDGVEGDVPAGCDLSSLFR